MKQRKRQKDFSNKELCINDIKRDYERIKIRLAKTE